MNTYDGRCLNVTPLLAIALLTSTHLATASAEPITAIYQIDIFERETIVNGELVREPFSVQFPLRVTIDPAQATESSPFGQAVFSPVPLETVPPPAELLPLPVTFSDTVFSIDENFAGARAAEFSSVVSGQPPESLLYWRTVQFSGETMGGVIPRGLSDAETFLMVLGIGPTGVSHFVYQTMFCSGVEGEEELFPGTPTLEDCLIPVQPSTRRLAFQGTATFERIESPGGEEPVPEPATIALVGSGIVFLLRKRHSSRRNL